MRTLAMLALLAVQEDRLHPEADKFIERIGQIEEKLKAGDAAAAKKAADELSASVKSARLVWWMFEKRQSRFADLAEKLHEAGEKDAARAFAVAVAGLLAHAGAQTEGRLARIAKDDPDSAFEFCKARSGRFEELDLKLEGLVQIVDRRLDLGTAKEEDLLLFRHRSGALTLMRKAAEKFPRSWSVQALWGDAATLAEKFEEGAKAYAASLELTKEPVREDGADEGRVYRDMIYERIGRVDATDGIARPRLVKLALAAWRSQGQDAAEQAIEKYSGAAFPLNVADAYHRVGSLKKAAPLYKKWLLTHPPLEGAQHDLRGYGHLACKTIEAYAKADMPREAFLARRALLKDFSPDAHVAGATQPRDLLSRADRAVEGVSAAVLIDRFVDQLVEAQKPSENETRRAGDLITGLSAAEPEARDKAAAGLKTLGPVVAPALKAALGGADAETRARIKDLLHDWALEAAEEKFRKE